MSNDVFLCCVCRTPEEFGAGHAVGAVNVPYMLRFGSGLECQKYILRNFFRFPLSSQSPWIIYMHVGVVF